MGVSMIGKQRRTPSALSPRDAFFSFPPSSPTVPSVPSSISPHHSSKTSVPAKLRNQKVKLSFCFLFAWKSFILYTRLRIDDTIGFKDVCPIDNSSIRMHVINGENSQVLVVSEVY